MLTVSPTYPWSHVIRIVVSCVSLHIAICIHGSWRWYLGRAKSKSGFHFQTVKNRISSCVVTPLNPLKDREAKARAPVQGRGSTTPWQTSNSSLQSPTPSLPTALSTPLTNKSSKGPALSAQPLLEV